MLQNQQPNRVCYRKNRSNGKILCRIHSFPNKPARHTWAECSENLINQWKPALQIVVDAHQTAINNCYLRDDDHSSMDSSDTEASDNDNGALVAACLATRMTPSPPFWLPLSLHARKLQRGMLDAGRNLPKRRGRPLPPLALTVTKGTWRTPSPPPPLPKVLKSPCFFLPTLIEGMHQWTLFFVFR
jgi:hypothetical protein